MFEVVDCASERIYIIKCSNIGPDLRLFEENVDEFIRTDHRDIIIDLNEQNVICSLLLAALIRIKRGLALSKRELFIRNCNPHMYRCIELAGLESFFSFCSYAV
jgi:anti-anti-sigma regulatory factor